MTVTDDGHGFDLERVRQQGSGVGLVSMEERAHAIAGEIQVVTGPNPAPRIASQAR
jgi:signal transduction histidine kinase